MSEEKKVLVEVSARHVHLSQKDLEVLFGEGYELTVRNTLSQPGQFAASEKVKVVGPRGELNMTILGPVRKQSQIEVSLTDARGLGIKALVRESGELEGTEGCKLVGPAGELELKEGVIAAQRHIHFTPEDAEKFGVVDKQLVSVDVCTEGRHLVFGDVVCRVSANYATAMHIDTDEGNACGYAGETYGVVITEKH